MTLRDVIEGILAVGVVLIGASGVLTLAWPAFRRMLLVRLFGSAWYAITEKTRVEERRQARRTRLRGAIGVVSEGLARGLHDRESHIQVAQAVAEFRTEGPAELAPYLDAITVATEKWTRERTYYANQIEIAALVSPIIDRLKVELGEG